MDLYDEFKALIERLNDRELDYALCGGLAMAVHSAPRATMDIDLLIRPEALEGVMAVARDLGYTIKAEPMTFADGAVRIQRVSKIDPDSGDVLMLGLMPVTTALGEAWESRKEVEWEDGRLWVVSREGMIALKLLRGSPVDLEDVERLKKGLDEG